MDFALTDEQQLLADTARTLLAKECPPALVRAHIDDPAVADGLWARLSEWAALGGGPLVDRCLFLEACGESLVPGPFWATTALAAPLLALTSSDAAPAVCAGEATATVALAGPSGRWEPDPAAVKTFVPEADRVDLVVVVAPGPEVVVAEAGALPKRQVHTLDASRRLFEVETGAARGERLPVAPELLDEWLRHAWVGLAAELLGTARRLLDLSVAYAKERVQFDRPIGSFQAIQHKLADMALDVERATAAVYYAAMCVDAGDPDRARAAHVAKAAAGAAATHAAKEGIQTHGGIGYTWEHDLHLYIRRAYASEHLLGSRGWHHDRIAALLLA